MTEASPPAALQLCRVSPRPSNLLSNRPLFFLSQPYLTDTFRASKTKTKTKTPVAVVVSFFICWVPFHAQRLLASYLVRDENQNQLLMDIYHRLTYISGVMYYLSSTINPLLYQLMSAKFRLAFKETFRCSLFRCAILGGARRGRTPNNSPTNSLKENQTSSQPACCSNLTTVNRRTNNHHQPLSQATSRTSCNNQSLAAPECSCLLQGLPSNHETDNGRLATQVNIPPSQACESKKPASYLAQLKSRLNGLFRFKKSPEVCCCFYKYQLIIHK